MSSGDSKQEQSDTLRLALRRLVQHDFFAEANSTTMGMSGLQHPNKGTLTGLDRQVQDFMKELALGRMYKEDESGGSILMTLA